jgi:hypothetical protein
VETSANILALSKNLLSDILLAMAWIRRVSTPTKSEEWCLQGSLTVLCRFLAVSDHFQIIGHDES